ncbi:hypothetical protein D9M68_451640 [compost metagenome]
MLDDLAVAQDRDLVAQSEGFVEIVGDEDDGLLDLLLQVEKNRLHVHADQWVEGRIGLVHQENRRVVGKRTSEADTLLHAAGKLIGVFAFKAFQTDALDPSHCDVDALRALEALNLKAIKRVVQNVAMGKQRELLEHHGRLVPSKLAQLRLAHRDDVDAVDKHFAGRRIDQAVDVPDEG